MDRKFKLPLGHPVLTRTDLRCSRCSKPIGEGAECYLDPEAPATPEDAVKARVGAAYTATARLAHWACHPTKGMNIDPTAIEMARLVDREAQNK